MRSRSTMPADASTAVTTQPRASAALATAPRPAPTSSTRSPCSVLVNDIHLPVAE
nr:hypothetical protein [Actinophytocola sp.]